MHGLVTPDEHSIPSNEHIRENSSQSLSEKMALVLCAQGSTSTGDSHQAVSKYPNMHQAHPVEEENAGAVILELRNGEGKKSELENTLICI